MPTTKRHTPEQLLQRAEEEARKAKRGRLKIYLGAAPGVGKTYQMLHDALEKRHKGLDVVVGIAESHGREEIEEMLRQLEILPRQIIHYRRQRLLEFNLDQALQRYPGLILVDEMAHTNAPGLRHAKRWQDIKELLDRGIDVYTTLNVQHIESLNNDVAQIIQAPIKETVPDSMLEMADTIELIDLPPDDLLKRLQEGKVYIPQQAHIAIEHFFRKGNLIALRGLALRTTAERVGAEVLMYRQGEGITHIWPTKDKILVCVNAKPESLKLIRAAKRMANSLQAEWLAIYIDSAQHGLASKERNQAIQNLRLAELLGAETHVLAGVDIVSEIINFAHENNVTQIMLWKTIRPRWLTWFRHSLSDELIRNSEEINIYIMTGDAHETHLPAPMTRKSHATTLKGYVIACGVVGIVTVLSFFIAPLLAPGGLILIYLLGIIGVALFGRIGPAVVATFLSVSIYDYLFIYPYHSFTYSNVKYFLTLIIMFVVAQVISQLIILTRRQTESVRLAQHQTAALYAFSRQLTASSGVDQLLETGTRYIANAFNCDVMALLPKRGHLEVRSSSTHVISPLTDKEQSIAEWVYAGGKKAGLSTDTLAFSKALYLPLLASQGNIGVIRVCPETQALLSPDQLRLLEACVNQLALALEIVRLQEKTARQEWKQESARVRDSLLQTISNTLHTPLVNVLGTAGQLITKEITDINEIEQDIYFEIEQLKRLNENISQISHLDSGHFKLPKTVNSIADIIQRVIKKSKKILQDREIKINVNKNLPSVRFNATLLEEVLYNLIDNATKFSPAGSEVIISAQIKDKAIVVSVEDWGPGIRQQEIPKLFEKFYRGKSAQKEQGLGLGLAICQKIIKVHGGTIWAENRVEGGAAFRFTLPLAD